MYSLIEEALRHFKKLVEEWKLYMDVRPINKPTPAPPKSVTEEDAAEAFVGMMNDQIVDDWPKIIYDAKDTFGENTPLLKLIDERKAKSELILAAMALDLLALRNIFPEDQASRLLELCILTFHEDTRDYIRQTFEEYRSRFDEDTKNRLNPVQSVGDVIYGRWGLAGDLYTTGEFFIAPKPDLAGMLAMVAFSYIGVWKRISAKFKVEEG